MEHCTAHSLKTDLFYFSVSETPNKNLLDVIYMYTEIITVKCVSLQYGFYTFETIKQMSAYTDTMTYQGVFHL